MFILCTTLCYVSHVINSPTTVGRSQFLPNRTRSIYIGRKVIKLLTSAKFRPNLTISYKNVISPVASSYNAPQSPPFLIIIFITSRDEFTVIQYLHVLYPGDQRMSTNRFNRSCSYGPTSTCRCHLFVAVMIDSVCGLFSMLT